MSEQMSLDLGDHVERVKQVIDEHRYGSLYIRSRRNFSTGDINWYIENRINHGPETEWTAVYKFNSEKEAQEIFDLGLVRSYANELEPSTEVTSPGVRFAIRDYLPENIWIDRLEGYYFHSKFFTSGHSAVDTARTYSSELEAVKAAREAVQSYMENMSEDITRLNIWREEFDAKIRGF